MSDVKPPELRGKDKGGNVRPADDRFLSTGDQRKRDSYLSKVEIAKFEAAALARANAPEDDPFEEVIAHAVEEALTAPDPEHVPFDPAVDVQHDQEELPNE